MTIRSILVAALAGFGLLLATNAVSAGSVAAGASHATQMHKPLLSQFSGSVEEVGRRRYRYYRRHRGPRFGIYIYPAPYYGYYGYYRRPYWRGRCYRRCRWYHGPRYCRRHAWRYC